VIAAMMRNRVRTSIGRRVDYQLAVGRLESLLTREPGRVDRRILAARCAVAEALDADRAATLRLERIQAVAKRARRRLDAMHGPNGPRWSRQGGDDAGGTWRADTKGTLR